MIDIARAAPRRRLFHSSALAGCQVTRCGLALRTAPNFLLSRRLLSGR
jgi:hypothetical protein